MDRWAPSSARFPPPVIVSFPGNPVKIQTSLLPALFILLQRFSHGLNLTIDPRVAQKALAQTDRVYTAGLVGHQADRFMQRRAGAGLIAAGDKGPRQSQIERWQRTQGFICLF